MGQTPAVIVLRKPQTAKPHGLIPTAGGPRYGVPEKACSTGHHSPSRRIYCIAQRIRVHRLLLGNHMATCHSAPLNSAYKQDEFEFYIDDLSSALAIVPNGSFKQDGPAVRAALKYKSAIAECHWDGQEVVLDVKDIGRLSGKSGQQVETAKPDGISLVLHSSGTTGRPKAVSGSHSSNRRPGC